ncbi:MAG: acyl-CoA reductase [Thermoguttaceae bacterium]
MSVWRITPRGVEPSGDRLTPIVESLDRRRAGLAKIPVDSLVALLADFSARLLRDPRTKSLEGCMFLSAWLGSDNLRRLLELNLNGNPSYLDGFVPYGRNYLAAKPQGLVAMWMAGNVATLPMFSLIPALLAKNVCLLKLAYPEPEGTDRLLAVLAESQAGDVRGADLLEAAAVVWFDYRNRELNEQMSLAADVKIIWGGAEAIKAITALPRREHCAEIVFGPKYSIGVIDRKKIQSDPEKLDQAVAGFVRDIAVFDQRACSAPQTIFVERNARLSLRELGGLFAKHLAKLPPKPGLDPYTTMQIVNVRAAWAMDEEKDVIASADGANWTVCLDRDVSLKQAVQSRTIFLSEVDSWQQVVPLLSPKVQTVGVAFGDRDDIITFAEVASQAGVARCVRPGLMNNHESPWDGKLLINQLVRWVMLKP